MQKFRLKKQTTDQTEILSTFLQTKKKSELLAD